MKNDRLFQTLYILLEKGNITAPALAQALEVSVRTVYRDVDALAQAGVPVYTSAGKGGGISLMPGYTLNRTLLSDQEQDQILLALQTLQAFDQPAGALLSKLGGTFRKQCANWIEVDFSRWGFNNLDHARFDLIKSAILEKQVLHLSYCGSMGALSERNIKPFKLVFKSKDWYLRAFCLKASDYRLFKISRIQTVMPVDEWFTETFEDAPPLDLMDMNAPPYELVRLRFESAVAFRVYDEFDRRDIETQPDGSLLVSVRFPQDGWTMGYLLTFGAEVTILEPAALQKQMTDFVRTTNAHYQT